MSNSTRDRWLALNYAAIILVSAFLLFQVQPLVTKHILPWFGGSPAVWTVCILFFQVVLLAGYVYVHVSQMWLRPAQQVVVQLAIIVAAAMLLGVLPEKRWQPREPGDPIEQILVMLVVSVGLPFFVLATTAPLVQAWFARSFPDCVPYRLYALSNLGSLLALLSYPFFFERAFDLKQQARLWSWGFVVYGVLCGIAGAWLWREDRRRVSLKRVKDAGQGELNVSEPGERDSRISASLVEPLDSPTWRQRVLWLLLPAFATVALLATTNHVCTDVATVPLLWVVPLALYLLTFIIAFDHPRWYRRTLLAALTIAAIYGAALASRTSFGWVDLYEFGMTGRLMQMMSERFSPAETPRFHIDFLTFVALNLAAMFGFCMLCHGELVRQRPHPRHLTSFYLMIAAGGVLGGVAVTLVAPHLFRTFFEWQLFMFFGAIWAIALVLHKLVQAAFPSESNASTPLRAGTLPLITLVVVLVPTSLVLLDLVEYLQVLDSGILFRERNFFGTLAVREKNTSKPKDSSVFLYHGIIAHGSQFTEPSRRGQPTTYYSTVSGVGRTLNFFRRHFELGGLRIGVVGLGTGTVAAYVGGGDTATFYEINPGVIQLTESGRWFTYLQDCQARGGKYAIKLGDARITLERELDAGRDERFHVLVLDAFSGDAIPIHLLTAEAFDTYARYLTTPAAGGVDGALVVHVSNRYLDLEPVVRGAAQRLGLPMATVHSPREPNHGIYEAEWIVLTKNASLQAELKPFANTPDEPAKPAVVWTDERSNLLDVVK